MSNFDYIFALAAWAHLNFWGSFKVSETSRSWAFFHPSQIHTHSLLVQSYLETSFWSNPSLRDSQIACSPPSISISLLNVEYLMSSFPAHPVPNPVRFSFMLCSLCCSFVCVKLNQMLSGRGRRGCLTCNHSQPWFRIHRRAFPLRSTSLECRFTYKVSKFVRTEETASDVELVIEMKNRLLSA